jgi:hypothetical protein
MRRFVGWRTGTFLQGFRFGSAIVQVFGECLTQCQESGQPPALPREGFASPDHRQHSTHKDEGGAGRRRLAGLHGSV